MSRNFSDEENLRCDVARLRELMLTVGRKRSLRDPLASACEQLQLTPSQVHALMWLGQDKALTMGELARRLGVTEKTMTGVVDRLEREGFVKRERSTTDRRVVHCLLAPEGIKTHQRLDRLLDEQLGVLLTLMDVMDRKALFRMLEKLIKRIED
ncbi:MarR family transcriptional regulator [Myxococcaceae bacterium GXIMD 01537]